MPLNTLGFAAGVVMAQNQNVPSDQVMRVALPAAILPNTALGVAVSDILAQQVAGQQPVATQPAVPTPTVTDINPPGAPPDGETSVTITGTNLTGATAVSFGATTVQSFSVSSDGVEITVTAPAQGANPTSVNVTVTTPGGTSDGVPFTYTPAPSVTGVSPNNDAATSTVTITGTNLSGASGVSFGSTAATNFMVDSSTQITAIAPTEDPGTVDVTVTTLGGTSATSPDDNFQFTGKSQAGDGPLGQAWVPAVTITPPQSRSYKPGDVIKVDPGLWQGVGPHHPARFQWYRDREAVERDGHSAQYKVKAADEGSKLTVEVVFGDKGTGYVKTVSKEIEIRRSPKRRSNKSGDDVEEGIIERA